MPGSSKAIRKRIKSVASTKKITRTMEMVATSKLQRTQGRVLASRPYQAAMQTLVAALGSAVEAMAISALFEKRTPVKRVLVLLITSNRGLCGGYNANLVRKAREHVRALKADGVEVLLHVAGKKGLAAMRFAGVKVDDARTDLTDRPTFAEAESVAAPLLKAFLDREVDRVDVVFADFRSAGHQPPTVATLLPVGASDAAVPAKADKTGPVAADEYLFEPDAGAIFKALGSVYMTNTLYRMLLSAVASEMLARRVAMKNASDNANDMERSLTRAYNKARQAGITQEIAEIVGGAAALE
jgi:F-type H+-transporting ATPase subunit gamma